MHYSFVDGLLYWLLEILLFAGGKMKIPGVLYSDGSDFSRREKRVAWQAGVELSTTSEQLALQVCLLKCFISITVWCQFILLQ